MAMTSNILHLISIGTLLACANAFSYHSKKRTLITRQTDVKLMLRPVALISKLDWKTVTIMGVISAPLGTLLDNYHGLFGVLQYNPDISAVNIYLGDNLMLKTSAWTPFLFSFAGAAMTFLLFLGEGVTRETPVPPSWPKVFNGIGVFGMQYYLSGLLDCLNFEPSLIHITLLSIAIAGILAFENTQAGLLLVLATAIAGPATEVMIINTTNAYEYTHADLLGICSWIVWIYAMGAPAVGNLAWALRSLQL